MTINAACQLWIEQRIEESLQDREDTDKVSLRAIGREISAEIERVFNAKVKPATISKRAERLQNANATIVAKPQPTQEQAWGSLLKRIESLAAYVEKNIDPNDQTYVMSAKRKKRISAALGRLNLQIKMEDERAETSICAISLR